MIRGCGFLRYHARLVCQSLKRPVKGRFIDVDACMPLSQDDIRMIRAKITASLGTGITSECSFCHSGHPFHPNKLLLHSDVSHSRCDSPFDGLRVPAETGYQLGIGYTWSRHSRDRLHWSDDFVRSVRHPHCFVARPNEGIVEILNLLASQEPSSELCGARLPRFIPSVRAASSVAADAIRGKERSQWHAGEKSSTITLILLLYCEWHWILPCCPQTPSA